MSGKRQSPRRSSKGRHRNGGGGLFEELAFRGLGVAIESHIQELVYDLLKDLEYQKFMNAWSGRLLEVLLRQQLARTRPKKRTR